MTTTEKLAEALRRLLGAHEKEAKAHMSAQVASDNFSRRSAKAEEAAHLAAMVAASEAEQAARNALAAWGAERAAPAEPAPDWEHLKPYGYAPGNYMSRCLDCGATPVMDKRALRCRPCAERAYATEAATPAAPATSDTKENTSGRYDGQRPAVHGDLLLRDRSSAALAGSAGASIADVLWNSEAVMGLNAELGLTMDQLVRLARAALAAPAPADFRDWLAQNAKYTQPQDMDAWLEEAFKAGYRAAAGHAPMPLTREPDYPGEVIDETDMRRLGDAFAGKTVAGVLQELGLKPTNGIGVTKGDSE